MRLHLVNAVPGNELGVEMNKAHCQALSVSIAAAAKSLQSCPTLCDPRDSSPPGSPVPGILQVPGYFTILFFLRKKTNIHTVTLALNLTLRASRSIVLHGPHHTEGQQSINGTATWQLQRGS